MSEPINLQIGIEEPHTIGVVEVDSSEEINLENYYTKTQINYMLALKLDANENLDGGTF